MKQESRKYRRGAYIEGNTVRSYSEPLKREYQNREEIRRQNIAMRRNREHALSMDLPYLVVLTAASFLALYFCCGYLAVQSKLTASIRNIEKQEKLLESIRNDNDALETSINTYVDLEHVYKVATEELGMVYANKNQVIVYDKTESEYVRQYEDIPD